MSSITNQEKNLETYYEAANTGRIFGRISSVFVHPMRFGLFIGLSCVYVFSLYKRISKWVFFPLLLGIIAMSIFCGVRSVIGGLILTFTYYIVKRKDFKLLCIVSFVIFLCGAFLMFVPELSDYLGSITDINNEKGAVKGSSLEMRLDQLNGAINEALKNPLFGLGYGWTYYYNDVFGNHPICYAFESLAYVVICNSGFIGILLWIYMVLKYFIINKRMHLKDIMFVNSLMIFYISYSLITGEYLYMKLFLMFYAMMVGESLLSNKLLTRETYG